MIIRFNCTFLSSAEKIKSDHMFFTVKYYLVRLKNFYQIKIFQGNMLLVNICQNVTLMLVLATLIFVEFFYFNYNKGEVFSNIVQYSFHVIYSINFSIFIFLSFNLFI